MSPNTKKRNEELNKILKKQMEEKKERDTEFVRIQQEQGKLWLEQDLKAKNEDYLKKLKKIQLQKVMHDEYSDRVAEKAKRLRESVMLSPSEVEINKRIYESSLAILESNSPSSSKNFVIIMDIYKDYHNLLMDLMILFIIIAETRYLFFIYALVSNLSQKIT